MQNEGLALGSPLTIIILQGCVTGILTMIDKGNIS